MPKKRLLQRKLKEARKHLELYNGILEEIVAALEVDFQVKDAEEIADGDASLFMNEECDRLEQVINDLPNL